MRERSMPSRAPVRRRQARATSLQPCATRRYKDEALRNYITSVTSVTEGPVTRNAHRPHTYNLKAQMLRPRASQRPALECAVLRKGLSHRSGGGPIVRPSRGAPALEHPRRRRALAYRTFDTRCSWQTANPGTQDWGRSNLQLSSFGCCCSPWVWVPRIFGSWCSLRTGGLCIRGMSNPPVGCCRQRARRPRPCRSGRRQWQGCNRRRGRHSFAPYPVDPPGRLRRSSVAPAFESSTRPCRPCHHLYGPYRP